MPLLGSAVLAVWNEVAPEDELDFNAWYQREHIPERLAVPGMTRARRYQSVEGSPRSMALYEAVSLAVLTSGVYREQLANPTPWTSRVMPKFRYMLRGLCDVAGSVGDGIGGAAAAAHLTPADPIALRRYVIETLLPALVALPDVTAAHLLTLAPGEPASATIALSQGAMAGGTLEWVIIAEAGDVEAAREAAEAIGQANLPAHGAAAVRFGPLYRLVYALERR